MITMSQSEFEEIIRKMQQYSLRDVIKESVYILNFAMISNYTQWLDSFYKNISPLISQNPLIKTNSFRQTDNILINLFLAIYFRQKEGKKKAVRHQMREILVTKYLNLESSLLKLTILAFPHLEQEYRQILSNRYRLIQQIFPDFFWDPKFSSFIQSRDIQSFLNPPHLPFARQLIKEIKIKFSKPVKTNSYEFATNVIDNFSQISSKLPLNDRFPKYTELISNYFNYMESYLKNTPSKSIEMQNYHYFFQIMMDLVGNSILEEIPYGLIKKALTSHFFRN